MSQAAITDDDRQVKIWGWIRPLYQDGIYRLVQAHAIAGGYCSLHRHDWQQNMFVIHAGKLRVLIYRDNSMVPTEIVRLEQAVRDTLIVPAGLRHRFEATSDCEFTELYFGQFGRAPSEDDIIREDQGGARPNKYRSQR